MIFRRALLAGALVVACGSTPTTNSGAAPNLWVTPYVGASPTRIVVWRRPGNPHGTKLGPMFGRVDETLLPPQALDSCTSSEHYFIADRLVLSIARGVPPTFDPTTYQHPPAVCASGGGCGPYWKLVSQASTGVRRFTDTGEVRQSVYGLPNGVWIGAYANSPSDLRLGPALASSVMPMPPSDLEPNAVHVEYTQAVHDDGLLLVPSYVGQQQVMATTVAVFPNGSRLSYLVRKHMPDHDRAVAAADDINRQRSELRARDPSLAAALPEGVRVEGATIVQRFTQ